LVVVPGGTGAGQASGSGFLAGYGYVARSAYATSIDLGFKPWTLDFTQDGSGPAFPIDRRFNPVPSGLVWQTDDWDPGLRFWTLPFDPQLTEWLQDLDLAAPSTMAAREFAHQYAKWQFDEATLTSAPIDWMKASDLAWKSTNPTTAWNAIKGELDELVDLMDDSRERYLAEALAQADGIPQYFIHLLGIDSASKPWTIQLMRCGLAIGNLVYMHYKAYFRRVRPSTLCPGLVPPFGPPSHPAFPSGHSFLGHFIALLLLEIPPVAARYGVGMTANGIAGGKPTWSNYKLGVNIDGALFWLAARLAKNRERIGVHYPTDGRASRQLAGGIWNEIFGGTANPIKVPTLQRVLERATTEWS
jgi:hypothetical protein